MTKEEGKEFANALKNNYTIDFDKLPDFCDLVISALEKNESAEEWYKLLCEKWDSAEMEDQDIAIKFCHEHKLLMVPVEAYHQMNVSAYAYANGLTYEEAEKRLLNEVKE